MSKRIKVWPPNGGGPIEVYQEDSGRLVDNGWTTEEPAKSKTDPAIEKATETDEGLSNGNIQGEQRNRKGRR